MALPLLAFSADALFNGVLSHLLGSSLAGFVILLLIAACRRASADLRRTLGWIGLFKFAVPAAALAPLLGRLGALLGWLSPGAPAALIAGLPGHRYLAEAMAADRALPGTLIMAMLAASAAVTAAILVRWWVRSAAFRRGVLAGASSVSGPLFRRVAAAASSVGLSRATPPVVLSESEGPGVLGFISPLLVIPRSLEGLLAPAELDSILVHELVHLERRDPLWGAARTLFLAVFWHNPVVWLLCRSIALETEKSCDEEVIRLTGSPEAYADGILKTVRHSLGLPDPSLTGAAGHSVSSRIKSILSPQSRTESPAMKMLVLSSACLIAVLTGYADPSSEAPASPKSEVPAGNVYDISKLDVIPRALFQARPVYPKEMRAQGVNAEVLVDFIIDPNGAVKNAFAAKASRAEFGKSAVDAVSQWKFAPGEKAGNKVYTHMQVPIVYTLNNDDPKS